MQFKEEWQHHPKSSEHKGPFLCSFSFFAVDYGKCFNYALGRRPYLSELSFVQEEGRLFSKNIMYVSRQLIEILAFFSVNHKVSSKSRKGIRFT